VLILVMRITRTDDDLCDCCTKVRPQDWDNNGNKVYDFRPQSDSIFSDDVFSQSNPAIGGVSTSLQLGGDCIPSPLGLWVIREGNSKEQYEGHGYETSTVPAST